jgi:hypothetical protein
MLLLARTTPKGQTAKRTEGLFAFIVDMRAALGNGLTIRPIRTMMNHNSTEVFFDNIDDGLNAGLNTLSTPQRMGRDIIRDRAKLGERRNRVAKPHKPCLAHTARTCPSVANSPREAATFEALIAARSPVESTTGASSSVPASRSTTRAMLS